LTLKLIAVTMSLERPEKEGQINNLRSNAYRVVKIWWKSIRWILR